MYTFPTAKVNANRKTVLNNNGHTEKCFKAWHDPSLHTFKQRRRYSRLDGILCILCFAKTLEKKGYGPCIPFLRPCRAADSLRFQLWNLSHPSCHPPLRSIFTRSYFSMSSTTTQCPSWKARSTREVTLRRNWEVTALKNHSRRQSRRSNNELQTVTTAKEIAWMLQ